MKIKPLIILIFTFIVGISIYYFVTPFHPSDQSMKTFFLENKDDFEKLRMMFEEEGRTCSTIYYSKKIKNYNCQISESRQIEYEKLFQKLGVQFSIHRDYSNYDSLTLTTSDVDEESISSEYERVSSRKGYVYSPKEPSPIKESLEKLNSKGYKKLEDNWYLFFEYQLSKPE